MRNEWSLEDTLAEFDAIIERAWRERSALGIFPSMYRSVTADIRDAVRSGFFDDGAALEHLSVVFADRYFDAFGDLVEGRRPSESWDVAFQAATDGKRRMIAQHLLAGMNAHIHLDLGIVTAEIAGDRPEELYTDFLRVNFLLFAKVDGLQDYLNSVSPAMAWLDRLTGAFDEYLTKIAIGNARDRAWSLAVELINEPDDATAIIARRDRQTADLGRVILGKRLRVRPLSWLIARTEPSDVRHVLDAFLERPVDLEAVERAVQATVADGPPDA
jgi:hypothetical protein